VKGIILIFGLVLLLGCVVDDKPKDDDGIIPPELPEMKAECSIDSDCVIGGCSGTLCQSKDSEQFMTTCEWKEEYACFKETVCSCIDGQCRWQETDEFIDCLDAAKESDDEVIV